MKNVMDTLRQRGFIKQTVYEEELYKLLGSQSVPFYIGFDPTADSLHVGHFLQLVAMRHMQKAGHKPIILIGGGTGHIGDPSGRTNMRSMMTKEMIDHNCERFKEQMSKFISFEGENAAIMVNNADWLLKLNYIGFIRDIGVHFSVNRMLTADCFKNRMEKGLSFLEFNYMLMQSYDFLVLYKEYNCLLQLGGDDQWSNILSGADLIRRKEGKAAYAMTFTLLATSDGNKMGKTAKGAVWLDAEKTSAYEFYQYWRNIDDADVENCMKLLTFIELDEIKKMTAFKDERMNKAKEVLAFELTKAVHGEEAAIDSRDKALAAFSGDTENMPAVEITAAAQTFADVLVLANLCKSKSEARRLIEGGGVTVNDIKLTSPNEEISEELKSIGEFIIYKGKKIRLKIILK